MSGTSPVVVAVGFLRPHGRTVRAYADGRRRKRSGYQLGDITIAITELTTDPHRTFNPEAKL